MTLTFPARVHVSSVCTKPRTERTASQGTHLEIMLRLFDDLLLVLVVNLLAIVMRKLLEAFPAHKQDSNLGQMFPRRNVTRFLEQLLELFLPPDGNRLPLTEVLTERTRRFFSRDFHRSRESFEDTDPLR